MRTASLAEAHQRNLIQLYEFEQTTKQWYDYLEKEAKRILRNPDREVVFVRDGSMSTIFVDNYAEKYRKEII